MLTILLLASLPPPSTLPPLPLLAPITPILSPRTDVNNEYPANADAGANVKTDSESKKFSNEGSSGATTADL